MPSIADASGMRALHPPDVTAIPQQRVDEQRAPARVHAFSVIVLAAQSTPLAAHIDAMLRSMGAVDVRYAASPADLLRRIPGSADPGVGIICRSPHARAVLQLVAELRHGGWRRLVIACEDKDDAAIRLAIAAKVRCLIRRPLPGAGFDRGDGPPAPRPQELSQRELQVLQAVADGHTNNEIGSMLGLSGLTVKSHLARIGRKTGTGDRAGMVAVAMRAGLVA